MREMSWVSWNEKWVLWNSTKGNAKSCSWAGKKKKKEWMWSQQAAKQLWRKGPGDPGGQEVKHELVTCLGDTQCQPPGLQQEQHCQQAKAGDLSSLVSTGEASSGLPSTRDTDTLAQVQLATSVIKGLEHLIRRERLRELGLFSREERWLARCKNIQQDGVKKTETDSSQSYPVKGQEPIGTNWDQGSFI